MGIRVWNGMKWRRDDTIATRPSLIEAIKNPEHPRWQEFLNTYQELLYCFARKSGLPHDLANDAVQVVLIEVSRTIGRFDSDPAKGSFKSWLLTKARLRILDLLRSRRRLPEGGSTGAVERVPAEDEFERMFEAEWSRQVVETALKRLEASLSNSQHYQIFVSSVIKEQPVDKLAELHEISANQIYIIRHRVQQKFGEMCKEIERRMS